ncbi:MAG: AAA family ATPase [Bacteroidales bacterium]|jgi:exodeoxyribonuclease-5
MGVESFLFEKMVSRLGFSPTGCQDNLFKSLAQFVVSKEDKEIMLINGYAGTGKTSAIAALVATLKDYGQNIILMAPTGRAAKVLSNYSGTRAYTIHKQIYRQKSMSDGVGLFTLNVNKSRDTIYIVDESSLLSNGGAELSSFGSGRLLDDLVEFIRSNDNNKLILMGDSAQLPPIGRTISDALDKDFLRQYGDVRYAHLKTVVRQAKSSGILHNATILREMIESGTIEYPKFEIEGYDDIFRIGGGDLLEELGSSYDKAGMDETLVLCRSNKRANRYNQGIRAKLLFREERLNRGDKLMVVKNCYQFLDDIEEIDFIANGDVAELVKISGYEERYGLNFAEAILRFGDYNDVEIKAKVILDTLDSETASLGAEQQRRLFTEILEEYSDIKTKRKRIAAVREDKYFNALQIKFASAITCHKSQGGQWSRVFIDNPFWSDQISLDDLKWLYTAMTRAIDRVYFVNFDNKFFK